MQTLKSPKQRVPSDKTQRITLEPVLPRSQLFLITVTTLLSAFLLFQIELMLGKVLLPHFGGGPSVWNTALLVFQILLMIGYAYAAFLVAKFSPKLQGIIHLSLLATSGLTMGLMIAVQGSPFIVERRLMSGTEWPVLQIGFVLISAVGIQFVLLSATNPLLQSWLGRDLVGATPYRLYALSNIGSLLGLLAYPVVVERVMTLAAQSWFWVAEYLVFFLTASACAWFRVRSFSDTALEAPPKLHKRKSRRHLGDTAPPPKMVWLALAACSSCMLLATTNLICQQIAPIPLLWVVPLALYLLSFVVCFDHARWYVRGVFYPVFLAMALLALKFLPSYSDISTTRLVVIFCSALMAVCMVCHGELARLKPAVRHLTSFYLTISVGGALGSAAVVILAPQIFDRFWEFQLSLLGCAVLLLIVIIRDRSSWVYGLRYGIVILLISMAALMAGSYRYTRALLDFEGEGNIVIARTRNFFGIKTVLREDGQTVLVHGHTLHGLQRSDPAMQDEPTIYYAKQTGIGLLLDSLRIMVERPLRVGVVGMGAGTLAIYGRSGDYFRFYEIDPDIPRFSLGARPSFTFVRDSLARVDVVIGDARVKMRDELTTHQAQGFDVLVVDAFSGDSVPVHLLTQEAMAVYLQQLSSPSSVVAFHLSSSNLDLRPVAASLASSYHLASAEVDTPPEIAPVWILMSKDPAALRLPAFDSVAHSITANRRVRTWTDDYSNLYELLRW